MPHHLIDIATRRPAIRPASSCAMRPRPCRRSGARGRQPLLVGGTMLYFHALSRRHRGIAGGGPAHPRANRRAGGRGGWEAVHEELARVDPEAAARIHVNDPSASSAPSRCIG